MPDMFKYVSVLIKMAECLYGLKIHETLFNHR